MRLHKLMAGRTLSIIIISMGLGWPLNSNASDVIAIEEKDEIVDISHRFSYVIDLDGQMSLEELASHQQLTWTESKSENINFDRGHPRNKVFAKINLDSRTTGNYTLTHEFTFDPVTRVRLLHSSAHGTLIKETYFLPKPTFEIALTPGMHTFIFEVSRSRFNATKVRFQLLKTTDFSVRNYWRGNFYGMIFGIAVAMCFYNLSMFYFFRNWYFLYYCPYVLGFATILAYGAGSIPYPDMHLFWNLPIILSAAFLFLFKSSALNLKTHTPKLYKTFFILTALHVITMSYTMATGAGRMSLIFTPFIITVAIACAFVRTKQGYKPAVFFVYGWSIFFLGFIIGALQLVFPIHNSFHFAGFIGFAIEIILFSFATSYKARLQEKKINQENEHAFRQLQKVFYPHQISQIKQEAELESTMPTHSGEACVISFDIIASSTIQHEKTKDFFRNVFRRCNEIMMTDYEPGTLTANAYRIKEMGDGFLCSVGYPFKSRTGFMAKDALEVATLFHNAFREEVEKFGYREPIYCGIGIAFDHIAGFYPETGTKEYDLYGKAIVLATRYEGMRKVLFHKVGASVLILQARVFLSLDREQADTFTECNLEDIKIVVRDDPAATKLYYRYLPDRTKSQLTSYDSVG
ncbi:MAG TPA: 7TM-DISM domain-containing protein [Oligoflexus sp.]|uniref:7TM-DISM domain-containing protein n=1 Tax=Oligoflexus sp. TaxID=1971216 RepID=UPI002D4C6623|nr:7TM-DISM domain-containing protein [Oligoflexus sp.]HYX35394.1 7TM-DISM domain-containing protein [Oligoflexus sp.]